jgi:hypothetical protein
VEQGEEKNSARYHLKVFVIWLLNSISIHAASYNILLKILYLNRIEQEYTRIVGEASIYLFVMAYIEGQQNEMFLAIQSYLGLPIRIFLFLSHIYSWFISIVGKEKQYVTQGILLICQIGHLTFDQHRKSKNQIRIIDIK